MSILEILLYAYKHIYTHVFYISRFRGAMEQPAKRWTKQRATKAMEEPTGPESRLSGPGASSGVF